MTIGGHHRTLFAVLVLVQIVTSLAGMAALARMGPAIGRILADNARSVHAAEQMLTVLAVPSPSARNRERFEAALQTARSNITEPEETEVLAVLTAQSDAALAGDPVATRTAITALTRLSRINREAMRRADAEAQELALAGRWALALLALLGILVSALSMRRARRKLLDPLAELVSTTDARLAGERLRRAHVLPNTELTRVLTTLNELLDEVERAPGAGAASSASELRAALALVLDRLGERVVLVDRREQLVAMSREALELVAQRGDELRAALRGGSEAAWVERADEVAGTGLRLLTLRAELPEPPRGAR